MSPQHVQALDFIRERITRAAFAPTVQEVANQIGCAKSRAWRIIDELVDDGYLVRDDRRSRRLAVPAMADMRGVPSQAMWDELARRGETAGAFTTPAPRRSFGGRIAYCAASCCDEEVQFGHAFCPPHYRSISEPVRREMHAAHAAYRRVQSRDNDARYQIAFQAARDEAEQSVRRAG